MAAPDKDWWDKSKVLLSGITAIIALAGVCVGYLINRTISENDLKIRMLNLSLEILRTTPAKHLGDREGEEFDKELREWALKVFRDSNKELHIYVPPHLLDELQTRSLPGASRGIDWTDIEGHRLPSGRNVDPGAAQLK